ncbi:MAG: hypothetical protein KDC87_22015, partial [Planctomycetes bacterium]|nr:hypothetical protein [Planctomycetota bacterium]
HEYPNPFVTAEVLSALFAAKQCGQTLDSGKVIRGLTALQRNRTRKGAFSYFAATRPSASVTAAAGRMPACELALLRYGKSTQEQLATALRAAFEHHGLLAAVRKYDDHADVHGYGGFFFWFDMLGRARAITALSDGPLRTELAGRMRKTIVEELPEIDGCFVDSHELGRTYGTAMALLSLAVLR